jgi:hypothetical protein
MGPARLAPSRYNQIAELLGSKAAKGPLTTREISEFIRGFNDVEERLARFIKAVQIWRHPKGLLPSFAPFLSLLGEPLPILPSDAQSDKPPSDE